MSFLSSLFNLVKGEKMSDRDYQVLSPLQKWHKYHRFPFKILLHTIVLALVILQVFVVSTQFTEYHRSTRGSFEYFFCTSGYDQQDIMTSTFYETPAVLAHLEKVVTNYYNLSDALAIYEHVLDEHNRTMPIVMKIATYGDFGSNTTAYTVTNYYNLTMADMFGPFNDVSNVNALFYSLDSMTLLFSLRDIGMVAEYGPTEFFWDISVIFRKPAQAGEIQLSMDITKTVAKFDGFPTGHPAAWLNAVMCVSAIISICLSVKALIGSHFCYNRAFEKFNLIPKDRLERIFARRKITPVVLTFDELPFNLKAEFYKLWHLVSIIGEFFLVLVFSSTVQSNFTPTTRASTLFLGLGSLFVCVNFTKYLEYNYAFYTLILTLRYALANVGRFCVGIMPVFIGYDLCGTALFSSYSDRFQDIGSTFVTLISLLNGDDIHATVIELDNAYPFPIISSLFVSSFVILFICSVLNVFIFIIEDGYHLAKVFSSGSLNSLAKKTVDHDSLLLWELLKHKIDMKKFYEIIFESELPEDVVESRLQDLENAYDDDEYDDSMEDSGPDLDYDSKFKQSESVKKLTKVSEGYRYNLFSEDKESLNSSRVANKVRERQQEFLERLNQKIIKTQSKFLDAVAQDAEAFQSQKELNKKVEQ